VLELTLRDEGAASSQTHGHDSCGGGLMFDCVIGPDQSRRKFDGSGWGSPLILQVDDAFAVAADGFGGPFEQLADGADQRKQRYWSAP
jgi:hypothetical protein